MKRFFLNRVILLSAAVAVYTGYAGSYSNPVLERGADPYCYRASDGTYYMVITGLGFFSSTNLVDWTSLGRLKINGTWGKYDFWAPEFIEYRGRFYLFYCARKVKDGPHFLGVAVSDRPEGPYQAEPEPLTEISPSIDPHVFIDDDRKVYLYWSEKGIGVDHRAINGCELSRDLKRLRGEPRMLIYSEQKWEFGRKWEGKGWNEGPFMLKHDGLYYLMYSANLYLSPYYGVGYAVSTHPLGRFNKFKKWENNPILSREGCEKYISGPGHHSVVASPDGKELFAVYHKHVSPGETERHICIDRMGFREDGTMYVNGPTVTPQPMPSGADGISNVAPDADVQVLSGGSEASARFLTDGEFSIHQRLADREWRPRGLPASVRLEWKQSPEISEVFIYGSGHPDRQVRSVSVLLSDGTVFDDLTFPGIPGGAASVSFSSRPVSWLEIRLDQENRGQLPALSEIMVRGR